MSARRVLVFPAGTEIGMEIHSALRLCKEVELFGAGQSASNHAAFLFEHYHILPSIHEEGWLAQLVALCRQLGIDYIFPAHDDVVVALATHRECIPTVVLTASSETCLITRSKSKTYNHLQSLVRVPRVYAPDGVDQFPLVVKPDRGQGSQGVHLVEKRDQLRAALERVRDGIICEYLPGEEYTIDCFSDRNRGVLFCGARARLRMRNGIAVHTRSVALAGALDMAKHIGRALGLHGAWFFQLKRAADGELTLLEVAPRIAGSMSTHRIQGVNFPLLTIYEHERLPIRLLLNPGSVELDRALRNRYRINLQFRTLYIDLDDTLLLRGQVNIDALRLVFSCINRGIEVKLITRHAGDLTVTLARHRLGGLFDKILHLDRTQRKADSIAERDAIFVDDSFSERWEVHSQTGIPTFDCSMLDALVETHPSDHKDLST